MKKNLFTLLLVAFTTVSLAQDVRYGVRGALNVSNLDFDPSPIISNEHRNGFAFGGFVDYGFSEDVSLFTELQWSAEGGKEDAIRTNYIKMPILLRLKVSERIILGAGPQLALKTWKDSDGYATFVFSGVAGAEYMFTDKLFIDARFYYGLSNILDKDLDDIKAKNHVIQFGFGIKI